MQHLKESCQRSITGLVQIYVSKTFWEECAKKGSCVLLMHSVMHVSTLALNAHLVHRCSRTQIKNVSQIVCPGSDSCIMHQDLVCSLYVTCACILDYSLSEHAHWPLVP